MYQISCWLYSAGETPNEFSVSWNGATLFDQKNVNTTVWTNLQFLAGATAANTVLQFGFRNDPSYFGLDDIAVYLAPPLQIQTVTCANGAISLGWSAAVGRLYQVQYTTNLSTMIWANLGGQILATNNPLTFHDPTGSAAARFYRLILSP
jgi:hypothetical protein